MPVCFDRLPAAHRYLGGHRATQSSCHRGRRRPSHATTARLLPPPRSIARHRQSRSSAADRVGCNRSSMQFSLFPRLLRIRARWTSRPILAQRSTGQSPIAHPNPPLPLRYVVTPDECAVLNENYFSRSVSCKRPRPRTIRSLVKAVGIGPDRPATKNVSSMEQNLNFSSGRRQSPTARHPRRHEQQYARTPRFVINRCHSSDLV